MGKTREIDGDQEQFWQMAIETWQASGMSVRQFCKQEGLATSAFYVWRKKLVGDSVQDDKDKPGPSAFIEVAMPRSNPTAVELLLTSGNTLRIPAGVDTATLSMILSVVRSAGLC
jgi:hypothetical protein